VTSFLKHFLDAAPAVTFSMQNPRHPPSIVLRPLSAKNKSNVGSFCCIAFLQDGYFEYDPKVGYIISVTHIIQSQTYECEAKRGDKDEFVEFTLNVIRKFGEMILYIHL
jgi:hypothetical protein